MNFNTLLLTCFILILLSCNEESKKSQVLANTVEKTQKKIEPMQNDTCFINIKGTNYSLSKVPDKFWTERESYKNTINGISESCYDAFFEIIRNRIDKNDSIAYQIFHNMIEVRNMEYFSDYTLNLFLNKNDAFLNYLEKIPDTLFQENLEEGVGYYFFNNEYVGEGEKYPEYENKIILINVPIDSVAPKYLIISDNKEYTGIDLERFINDLINNNSLSVRKQVILKIILKRIEFARYINS